MIRQHLEYIVILAEEKSITRAAERLGVTQSAFSQHLSGLEKNLGIPLFNRVRNKIALTYAGEIYLAAALDILKIQKDLVNRINDLSASGKGKVSFGIGLERGIDILPQLFPAFSAAFPDTTLHIEQGTPHSLEELTLMGHCDVVLLSLFGRGTALASECIGLDELLLAVPDQHPLAGLASRTGDAWPIIDPALLHKAPFVLTAPNTLFRPIANAFFLAADIQPKIIFESESVTAVYDTALSIGAFCLVPEALVHHRDPQRHHACYSIDRARYSLQMVVAWRQGAYLSRAARGLIEILRGILKNA